MAGIITAKNKLVIGVVKPILQKLWPTYGRTNQPKLTENAITTLCHHLSMTTSMAMIHILRVGLTI